MLVEFQITNFRSFRDTQRFSMVASADTTMLENTIEAPALGKQRLLRSAVIYGANAAGKSNFISALEFVQTFATQSEQRGPGTGIPVQPFRLGNQASQLPTIFELTFLWEGVRYQYGFSLDKRRVLEEWLIAYPRGLPQRWFTRRYDPASQQYEMHFGSKLKGQKRELEELTRPDVLFLSVAARFNHQQLTEVYNWFKLELYLITSSRSTRFFEEHSAWMASEFDLKEDITALLRTADLGIVDFVAEEQRIPADAIPADLPEEFRSRLIDRVAYSIQMQHRSDGDRGDGVPFSWEEESEGTRRLFGLAGPLVFALRYGRVLAIDELDASLHPSLVRLLVQLFHLPQLNQTSAQLIFNTHDTTLLDATLMRRDQIWFVEKDNTGASQLYPLLDFSPRKDEALARGYLRGRYGAIPFLSDALEGLVADASK
jgi:uncharacterized protein